MTSSKPKTAEANFRAAFERLKQGTPRVLPPGTPVSQNNVAKDANCDPSALRKSRFPSLVAEIQSFLATRGEKGEPSKRQLLLKQRQKTRDAKAINSALKVQRDVAASLLVEANARIGALTLKVRDLEFKLEHFGSQVSQLSLKSAKPKATPRAMDIGSDN